jgi:hypothetical protein
MDTIRAIQPPEKWKLMVIDSQSIKILTAVCNKYDILEENVSKTMPRVDGSVLRQLQIKENMYATIPQYHRH